MRPSVVVYDSEGVLPPTFVRDVGLDDGVVLIDGLADAHRVGRRAEVLVIVAGRDEAGALGLLTSPVGSRARTILLFLVDAQHHRRVLLHGARRGAIMLIAQPPAVLAACLRELVAPQPFDRDGAPIYRATGLAASATELCLLLVAARHRPGRRRGLPRWRAPWSKGGRPIDMASR